MRYGQQFKQNWEIGNVQTVKKMKLEITESLPFPIHR